VNTIGLVAIELYGPTQVADRPRTELVGPLRWVTFDGSSFEVPLALPLGWVAVPGHEGLAFFQVNFDYLDLPDAKFSGHGVPHTVPMAVVEGIADLETSERNRHFGKPGRGSRRLPHCFDYRFGPY